MNVLGKSRRIVGTLALGSSGPDVRELQLLLNSDRIRAGLKVDGKFGKTTHRALVDFQKRNGLKADGVVGGRTARVLGWSFVPGPTAPYKIRMDRPAHSETSSPLQVLGDVIYVGLNRLGRRVEDEIRRFGLSPNATHQLVENDLKRVIIPGLRERVGEFLNVRLTDDSGRQNETQRQFDVNLFRRSFIDGFDLFYQMARTAKEAGGNVHNFAIFLDRARQLERIGEIAERLLKGEQNPAITIQQIKIAFDTATGF